MLAVRFNTTEAGRSQPVEYLRSIDADTSAQIVADINAVAEHLNNAPVSWKPIAGHRPMYEIRTGGHRAFYVIASRTLWVLHACKKQDQRRGIEVAARRMKEVLHGYGK